MTTYRSMGTALADPESNAAKTLEKFRSARRAADVRIAQLMAEGLSREDAYLRLFTENRCRPRGI